MTVSSVAEATPDDVVAAAAITFDGSTRICIEAHCPVISQSATGVLIFNLWEAANNLGYIGEIGPAVNASVLMRRFLTPTAGSKTYKLRAFRATANVTIKAGAGGAAAAFTPIYIRIITAPQ